MTEDDHTLVEKTCTRCKRSLPANTTYFSAHSKGRLGLQSRCRECLRAVLREHYRTEKGRAAGIAWKAANKEKMQAYLRQWQQENKDKTAASRKKRLEMPGYREKLKSYNTAWAREKRSDPEWRARWLVTLREWQDKPEVKAHRRAYRRKYIRDRTKRDPDFRCKFLMATGIRRDLKRIRLSDLPRPKWWEKYCGYTLAELRRHIEQQFTGEMAWSNHGEVWEIDHIRPLSSFSTPTLDSAENRAAWALSNLRPLLKHLNQLKGAKLVA